MPKIKCIFLGYDEKKTKLIKFLENKNIKVNKILNNDLKINDAINADIIISFGYSKIINEKILSKLRKPIINLHMSYLPYNRGAHPNFWSFIDSTPKGVTIHEISEGVDEGDIIFQKQYYLDPSQEKFSTFKKTYLFLFQALEDLFITNFDKIINYPYLTKKQDKFFTIHRTKDLPKTFTNWDENIQEFLSKNN